MCLKVWVSHQDACQFCEQCRSGVNDKSVSKGVPSHNVHQKIRRKEWAAARTRAKGLQICPRDSEALIVRQLKLLAAEEGRCPFWCAVQNRTGVTDRRQTHVFPPRISQKGIKPSDPPGYGAGQKS
jgi:hypothetical protein